MPACGLGDPVLDAGDKLQDQEGRGIACGDLIVVFQKAGIHGCTLTGFECSTGRWLLLLFSLLFHGGHFIRYCACTHRTYTSSAEDWRNHSQCYTSATHYSFHENAADSLLCYMKSSCPTKVVGHNVPVERVSSEALISHLVPPRSSDTMCRLSG